MCKDDISSTADSDDDFVDSKVTEQATSSGLHLALIITGGTIGYALFIVANQIGGALGLQKAAYAFAAGCLVLGLFGAVTSYIGARTRCSTYLLAEFSFGTKGAQVAKAVIAISLLGWFSVINATLGEAIQKILLVGFDLHVSSYVTIILSCVVIIAVVIHGFTGIDRFALYLTPVMILFLFYLCWVSLTGLETTGHIEGAPPFTLSTAINAVIGSYIAGVVTQPDYSRFARTRRHAIWGVFVALGVVFPIILLIAAVPGMATKQMDFLAAVTLLGLLAPSFVVLFFGAWGSNVLTLYSSSLSIGTIIHSWSLKRLVFVLGVTGTIVALLPVREYLIFFLVALSVSIPPIAAIYTVEAFLIRRFDFDESRLEKEANINFQAIAAWVMAILFGYLSENQMVSLTGIASLDSIMISAIGYYGLMRLFPRKIITTDVEEVIE